ncbi:hypothetical protein K2P97_13380 [bacterium]|nr:hypothetical protein [bacterium]
MKSNGLFYFRSLLVALTVLCSLPVYTQETKPEPKPETPAVESTDIFYLCKRDRTTRWLRAYKLENGKCQTLYSKEGYLQIISSATYFASCEGVLHSVRKNLEEGQFKCTVAAKYNVLELE